MSLTQEARSARGCGRGVLAAAGVPVTFVSPPAWKRRPEAIRRWPARAELFARVKDDDRAEAALIAVAGLMRKDDAP
jgi:crossover junction endodeoxyribonuclease RuvC